jgi:hypothetical protein
MAISRGLPTTLTGRTESALSRIAAILANGETAP